MPGIQIVGGLSGVTAEVEAASRSQRVTNRPIDPLTLGSYVAHYFSGTMAAGLAAAAEIYQFRWADATRLAVLRSVKFSASEGTVGFTRGVATVEAVLARSWSANGTGGANVDMSGNNGKKRTSMGTSLISASG